MASDTTGRVVRAFRERERPAVAFQASLPYCESSAAMSDAESGSALEQDCYWYQGLLDREYSNSQCDPFLTSNH